MYLTHQFLSVVLKSAFFRGGFNNVLHDATVTANLQNLRKEPHIKGIVRVNQDGWQAMSTTGLRKQMGRQNAA